MDRLEVKNPLCINLGRQTRFLLSIVSHEPSFAQALRNVSSRSELLATLSSLLFAPSLTLVVAEVFRPILFDLCSRWLLDDQNSDQKFIALCLLLEPHQDLFPVLSAFLRKTYHVHGPLTYILSSPIDSADAQHLHCLLLAYYRILHANRKLPNTLLWPLLPLTKLIHAPHPDTGVRFLAVRCYALQTGMGEAERVKLEKQVIGDVSEVDCPIFYSVNLDGTASMLDGWVFPAFEEKRILDSRNAIVQSGLDYYLVEENEVVEPICVEELSPFTVNVHGIFLFRNKLLPATTSQLVMTPNMVHSLQQLALHISLRFPVLITSAPSSGKSLLLSHLADILYPGIKNQIITIHLADASLDPRSLLGSYVSSSTNPGTFEWKEGTVVQAMKQGKWVVFKDIDRATNEVLGVLKPLIESLGAGQWIGGCAAMEVPGQGRIEASEHFALFATRSIPARDGRYSKPTFLSAHKLHEIIHPTPTRDELQAIVDFKFPTLAGAPAHSAIRLWECVCAIEVTASTSARAIGTKELEKFCARLERLLPHSMGFGSMPDLNIKLSDVVSNPSLREEIYLEARDVFFGSGTLTAAARLHTERVASIVGDHLGLTVERQSWLLHNRVPELEIEKDVNGRTVALRVGRNRIAGVPVMEVVSPPSRPFVMHKPAISLLSRLSNAIVLGEPVLLTGETGTGKTSIVTHLASILRKPLISLNLSNQTESSDLLGGFKPIDARVPGSELQAKFAQLFGETFSRKKNAKFEESVRKAVLESKWKRAVVLWVEAIKLAKDRIRSRTAEMDPVDDHREDAQTNPRKRRKVDSVKSQSSDVSEADWLAFERDVVIFDVQHVQEKGKFAFAFVEGPLIKALRSGDWILLDEINLASPETLECISGLLQSSTSSITLTEQGSLEPVPRHPDFRIFACMNPATDVGKKDLPPNTRSRFTEIDVSPPDADHDTLVSIVEKYIGHCAVGDKGVIIDIVEFYMAVKQLSEERRIVDGSNHRPHYSMRTLARALMWAADMASTYNLRRALWEGCLMAFTMVLDSTSAELVIALARRHILAGVRNVGSLLSREPAVPSPSELFVKFGPFYLGKGTLDSNPVEDYILTPSVEKKLIDLARIIVTRRFPVLIEGPTSSGKTSSIEYLARATCHRFVRINNHEHTDIQEYLGTYVSDPVTGKLVFKDGLLVRALRNGDWIVLDELNLAPTDVLEALNRLLDDNRELVIPETQEVIRPHPHFLLFATQNPPGLYAGRKVLSRAFRNRFLEVHFEDVPQGELETILCQRCRIAPSYAERIVRVFQELQKRRQSGRVFESKHGFATLRDLFRWAERDAIGYQQLAENGYMLLAERTRKRDDKEVVKEVIESIMKVKIDENTLYDITNPQLDSFSVLGFPVPLSIQLAWTRAMRRLFVLVARALRFHEPVLLVGETGSGKTSVCQVYAEAVSSILTTVNCHQNTETADLIGGLRPVRNRASLEADAVREATVILGQLGISEIPSDPEQLASSIDSILKSSAHSSSQARVLEDVRTKLRRFSAMFEWHDGPLVRAMRNGEIFLLDEISLADDSVLERLNSVLEPARTIVLAERGGDNVDAGHIQAEKGFKLVATMNPGGDYGKKELSPALRNRFTEIWVPPVEDRLDLENIVDNLWSHNEMRSYTKPLLDFVQWLSNQASDRSLVALRDILAWVTFSNSMYRPGEYTTMPLKDIFHHAANMTYLDGLGAFPQFSAYSSDTLSHLKASALLFIQQLIPLENDIPDAIEIRDQTNIIEIGSFPLPKGSRAPMPHLFNIRAPTTLHNAMRIARACQVSKPVLLEGSPGVGKTSLISALANLSGHHLARINLSDQTDLIDLFGSDLPVEGGRPGEFAWRDAEFLKALQDGHWVLLDEMNLAPQAILEGLNSVLDHRGSVYIPELGRSFHKHPDFRIFAAQNPLHQGGGRKGLPKSFLNRFTKVYLEELSPYDLLLVCRHLFPDYPVDLLRDMITFNTHLNEEVVHKRSFAREGSPWEFNLRDVIRWGALLQAHTRTPKPIEYLQVIYLQRFRTESDRERVVQLFTETFQTPVDYIKKIPRPSISASYVQIGSFLSDRRNFTGNERSAPILQSQLNSVEAVGACLSNNWLVILTGSRESGKTNLVRYIASLTGNVLHEISIHNATDITDILGSFEQVDYRIQVSELVKEVSSLFKTLFRSIQYVYLQETAEYHALQTLITSTAFDDLPVLLSTLQTVLHGLPQTVEARTGLLHKTHTLTTSFESTGRFEWVDGPLVRALRHGHWMLLDGANLCNPSVLDRLNSLCESGGILTLSERGHTDGVVEVINPHPNFRLFMALDASQGELSRAMRNRGVEISLNHSRTPEDQKMCSEYQRLPVLAASCTTRLTSAQFALWRRGLLTGIIPTLPGWPASSLSAEDSACRSLADYADALISSSQSPNSEDSVLYFAAQSVPPAYLMYFVRFLHALGPSYSGLSRLQTVLRTMSNQRISSFFSRLRDKSSQTQGVPSDFLTVQPMEFFLNSLPCYTLHNETDNSSQHEQIIRMLNLHVDTYIGDEVQPELEGKVSAKDNTVLTISSRRQLLIPRVTLEVKALLGSIQATAKSLLEKMSFDVSGTLHQEDILLASQLLHYGHYLRQIVQNQPFDYSSVQVVSRWILNALVSASYAFEQSVYCAKKLEESVALSSGLGFHDIWSAFLSESGLRLLNESSYELEAFASSCKDPSSIFGIRSRVFQLLSLQTLPNLTAEESRDLHSLTQEVQVGLKAHQTDVTLDVTSEQTHSGLSFFPIELNILRLTGGVGFSSHNEVSSQIIQQVVDLICHDDSLPILRFIPYQHALWASEGNKLRMPAILQIQKLWLEIIWKADPLDTQGPSTLLRPFSLNITHLKCDWSHVRLADLDRYRNSLLSHQRLTKFLFKFQMSRSDQLTGFLVQSILLLLSCFISTSESSLSQYAISLSRRADIGSRNSVKQLLHLMDQLRNPLLNPAPVANLRSALGRVANCATTGEGSQLLALGHCWIAFSQLAIDLYLPDAPIDPYAIHQCTDEFWQSREDILMSQIHRHKLLENRLTGDSKNKVTQFLEAELGPIRERLSSVSITPRRGKQDVGRLHAYWSEISQFMNQVISSKLDPLLTASSSNAHLTSQEGVFQESVTGFCQRLQTAYPEYNDITSPFSWGLYHMKFGVRLATDASQTSANTFTSLAEALVAFPTILCSEALTVQNETLRGSIASPFGLIMLSLHAIAFEVSAGVTLRRVLPFLIQAYDQAVNLWLADRVREVELERKASSLYRNNASLTDEEQELRELMELFPDFEQPLENNIESRMSDSRQNKLVDASHCLLLFQIHHHLMSPCISPKLEEQFQDARRDSLGSLLAYQTSLISCSLDVSSLHHQYSMLLDRIASVREDPENQDSFYNFYHDTNVEEVDRATKVVRALRERLRELILEWPDQMVLQHLRDRCETLLSLHINSSVAHVLASVEQLLLQSEDWEMYANRQNTLSSHRHELVGLIVRWRRLELSCWSGLLETEARKFGQGVSDWWFQLYEAFIRGYDAAINDVDDDMSIVDRYLDGLIPLLDNFLAGSPIGQFLSRMQLVEDFEGYIDHLAFTKSTSEALWGRLSRILHNTRVYHTQFVPAVSAHLTERRGVVEKEIQGFIKLASWKDINVHALKQSAKRTHHQLYKTIRKFREILRLPVSTFLHPAQAGSVEQKTGHQSIPHHLPMHDHVPSFPEVISVHPRPTHLANLGRTFSKFNELIAHNSSSSISSFVPIQIDELAVKIIVGSAELSQESVPSSLSKEKRQKHLKVLFVRKKKAFSDLLKELRRIGISANVKPEVLRKQGDKRHMMEQPILSPAFDAMDFDEKGEMYFHRLLGLLPELRTMTAGHHEDVTTHDLQRGILLLESGVSMALKSRSSLASMLSFREQVHSSCRRFRSILSCSNISLCGSDLPDQISCVNDTARKIQSALGEILEAVSMHDDMDDVESIKENMKSSALEVVTKSCQYLSTVYDAVRLTPIPVLLEDERSVLNSAIGHMRSISGQLRTWSDVHPPLLHLFGPFMAWLDKLIWPNFNSSQELAVSSLHDHVDEVIETFLLTVQSILKLSTKPDSAEEDAETSDNFIKDGLREIESINASLHLEKVLKQLNSILNDCSSAPEHDVKDAVARFLPFLERYLNLVDNQLLNHGRWTSAMFKLDYILCSVLKNVATNGFCKPPETETDGEGEGGAEVSDGVGLGEGTGNENVSKEIEDESQVEGLQDEGTENEQRDKNQGDENAIEMSEDIGGDLEDVDDTEVEEEDQSESGSEADPEERAEHLEDNDSSALDEKLWGDESGPEESKGSEDKTHEDHSKEDSKTSDVVAKEKPQKNAGKAEEKDHQEEQESEPQEIPEEDPETEDPNASGAPMEEHIDEADTLDLPENMNLGEEQEMQSLQDQESDEDQLPEEAGEEGGGDSEDVPDRQNDAPEVEDEAMDEDRNEGTIEAEKIEDQPPDEDQGEKPISTQPDLHSGDGKNDGLPESGTSGAGIEPEEDHSGVQGSGEQTSGESDMQEKAASDSLELSAEATPDVSRGNDGKGSAAPRTGKDSAPSPTAQLSTNPLRNLGDTLREVRRNLDQILESSEQREEAGQPPTELKESQQLQYIRPDEDDENMQALGAAGDDQAAKLSDLKLVDDEQPPDDSTPMEVDEPAMPERTQGPKTPAAQQISDNIADKASVEGGLNQDEVRSRDTAKNSSTDPSTLPAEKDAEMSEEHTQEDIEARLKEWQAQGQPEQGAENIWRLYESLTHDLSYALCEQLRLILEPTQATRLKGDYRTGKRLNMKKIIPYIASEYTKDKIWLRRTRPSQREYQVLISLDDSRSMAESHSIHLAYQTLALVSKALSRLEVGDVAIAKFGKTVDVLHGFSGGPFTDQAGTSIISSFRFDQKATDVLSLIETSLKMLEDGREHRAGSSSTAADLWQLEIIISDGICQDHERLRTVLRRAEEQRVMIVFVILDSLHSHVQGSSSSSTTDNSILSMQQGVAFKNANGMMEVKMERYLDSFPFEYYVVLRDVESLPDILSGTLKQFFERISED